MPLSVALPSPTIQFFSRYDFPVLQRDSGNGSTYLANDDWIKGRPARASSAPDGLGALISAGGTGVVRGIAMQPGGRPHARVTTTTVRQGDYLPLNDWIAGYGGGVGQAVGSLLPPPAVVMTADIHFCATAAAYSGAPADSIGIYFFPNGGGGDPWALPGWGGSTPSGGFGIVLNDDGGGQNQFQFLSYDAVPNILQRTALAVPDVTLWSTFRFILRSAIPGRPANLTLQVNGDTVGAVNGLEFDDVTLFRPNTLNANATGFAVGQTAGPMGGAGIRFALAFKFGRFTPDGQEVQGIT